MKLGVSVDVRHVRDCIYGIGTKTGREYCPSLNEKEQNDANKEPWKRKKHKMMELEGA